ncbi:hypothetical protein ACFLXT_02010 [Chloroflexota bacterium]
MRQSRFFMVAITLLLLAVDVPPKHLEWLHTFCSCELRSTYPCSKHC